MFSKKNYNMQILIIKEDVEKNVKKCADFNIQKVQPC